MRWLLESGPAAAYIADALMEISDEAGHAFQYEAGVSAMGHVFPFSIPAHRV
jgi:hypothetical protein